MQLEGGNLDALSFLFTKGRRPPGEGPGRPGGGGREQGRQRPGARPGAGVRAGGGGRAGVRAAGRRRRRGGGGGPEPRGWGTGGSGAGRRGWGGGAKAAASWVRRAMRLWGGSGGSWRTERTAEDDKRKGGLCALRGG